MSLWDSSIHQSPYLNQITPLDRNVYLTVKINLKLKVPVSNKHDTKFKSSKYIDLVLRKRIAVNVVSAYNTGAKFGLKRFTKLLTSTGLNSPAKKQSNLNMTSLIYRVILSIPKSLIEIENRESLALQAATSLANNSIDDQRFLEKSASKTEESSTSSIDSSLTQFQHYAKTIAAVDSILKQDRLQQQMAIRSAFNLLQQTNLNNSTSDELQSYKMPSLLKTGFDSIMNLSSLSAVSESPEQSTSNIFSKKIGLMSITNEAKSRLSNIYNF